MKACIFFALTAFAVGVYGAGYVELSQVMVVHYDGTAVDDLYNYAAAVPVAVYRSDGRFYRYPLYTDAGTDGPSYDGPIEVDRVLLVGDVPPAAVPVCPGAEEVVFWGSSPVEIAVALSSEWLKSDEVVLAVYDRDPTEEQLLALLLAAGLSSYLNAPLMFVEPDRVPAGTLLAGGRLCARSAYLFDFGARTNDRVREVLARGGFAVTAVERAADAAGIIEELARSDGPGAVGNI